MSSLAVSNFVDHLPLDKHMNIEDMQPVGDSYLVDNLMIKGVSMDRSLNASNVDYALEDADELKGLRHYFHKAFLGNIYYYLHPIINEHEVHLEGLGKSG